MRKIKETLHINTVYEKHTDINKMQKNLHTINEKYNLNIHVVCVPKKTSIRNYVYVSIQATGEKQTIRTLFNDIIKYVNANHLVIDHITT